MLASASEMKDSFSFVFLKALCQKLVILILMVDDPLRGNEIIGAFADRELTKVCMRIALGKSKADKVSTAAVFFFFCNRVF